MKYKLIFFLVALTNTVNLLGTLDLSPYKNVSSKDEQIVKKITSSVAQKLLTKHNLHLIGTGAQMMNDIEMLAMDFYYYNEVDLQTARNLLVISTQNYLDEINQNTEIRRYLKNYPFTAKNIEIGIYILKPDGSKVSKEKLYYISAINGILHYYIDDPKNYSRITLHQETYDQALKAINPST